MAKLEDVTLKNISSSILNSVADVLESSDFISRTIGMNNSYSDIMFIVQALGREPISLLGKNYAFIYDHVRRNYMQGMDIPSVDFKDFCNKFTFYKEVPTIRFANPYDDPMNLLKKWVPDMSFGETSTNSEGASITWHYNESDDGRTDNKYIGLETELEFANPGTYTNQIGGISQELSSCDMVGKTNSNFLHGKYQTLISRFHTNDTSSKDPTDSTQTAFSKTYGQSHGRNLLKKNHKGNYIKGYDNPYCRVWTYFNQYNQIKRQIRPLTDDSGSILGQESLESKEQVGNYNTVGFRTIPSKTFKIEGGSKRLDKHGVLNYQNGTVNIAPTAKIKDYFEGKQGDYDKGVIETKKCMFSLENLAWRDDKMRKDEFDAYGLSPEQKGPLGGRIMWFPPYNLKFSEDVSVDWNKNKFIGRGEDVLTYTNTERRGNLSFTLLIDHPSILDYWTGHDRNGMKNNGKPLDEGNSGGVDNVNNQENTLLRFFAGCEILTAKPQEYRTRNVKANKVEDPKNPINEVPPVDVAKKVRKKICAILYYPNNYSGKDDRKGVVDPIWYLMNGIGTQKYVNETTKEAVDLPTTIDTPSYGYEMRSNSIGISVVDKPLYEDYCVIKSTYADLKSKERKAQYLTKSDGDIIEYTDKNGMTYKLAKIVGNKAMSLGNAKGQSGGCSVSKNVSGASHLWYRRRYYYRVDKKYENQEFSRPESYIDGISYGLNCADGYNNIRKEKYKEIANTFGVEEDSENYRLVSFADLFTAVEGNTIVKPNVVSMSSNSNNVTFIEEVLNNKDVYSNIKISFAGHASYQGDKVSNNDLAKNRWLTIKNWLNGFTSMQGVQMGNGDIKNQSETPVKNVGGADEEKTKLWRSASITIEYDEQNVENAATAEQTKFDKDGNAITDRVEVKTKEVSNNNTSTIYDWLRNTPEGQAAMASHPELKYYSRFDNLTIKDIERITGKNYTNADDWATYNNSWKQMDDFNQSTVKRYDNEGEFFQTLSDKDPFLHHLISEKIKFFDPAFHSISPEGFNARLTFLHQCTRQGSTVGNADSSVANTAYNLAFGRPPICVLRVGDFYYTKIVITSLSIQYDQPQWDMNPEGIGMMPMFADISIQFTFLGGSDLGGPIARLQNAVSFNYYANASVYDNRAEKVEYDPSGNGKELAFKGYNYPNMYIGDRRTESRVQRDGKLDGIEPDEF